METISKKTKYVKLDGWRGYSEPINAIGGCNHTGGWSDSPCPTDVVKKELNGFKKILRQNGIKYVTQSCLTTNVFCEHVYILVHPNDREQGSKLSLEYSELSGIRLFYSC